MVHGIEQMSV